MNSEMTGYEQRMAGWNAKDKAGCELKITQMAGYEQRMASCNVKDKAGYELRITHLTLSVV